MATDLPAPMADSSRHDPPLRCGQDEALSGGTLAARTRRWPPFATRLRPRGRSAQRRSMGASGERLTARHVTGDIFLRKFV